MIDYISALFLFLGIFNGGIIINFYSENKLLRSTYTRTYISFSMIALPMIIATIFLAIQNNSRNNFNNGYQTGLKEKQQMIIKSDTTFKVIKTNY